MPEREAESATRPWRKGWRAEGKSTPATRPATCRASGLILSIAVMCGAWSARVCAGQGDFGVGLSLTYDSNVSRSEVNPQADLIQTTYAGFSYLENTADVSARLFVQMERRRYQQETFNNDTAGIIDAAVVWSISPRRFTFTVENVFREVLVTVTQPDTPSNRTNANALNTGPDLTFRLSSSNSV